MTIFKSALAGLLLVVAACILLFWAEGRAVKTARALEEGSGLVVEVDASRIDPANDGKLVHISGAVAPQDVPTDTKLGITAKGSVRLIRTVEMYQWKEVSREVERTASDGSKTKSTVYDYEKLWSESAIESSRFKTAAAPKNPPMPMSGMSFDVGEAKVGAFRIAGDDVASLGDASAVPLTDSASAGLMTATGGSNPVWLIDNQFVLGNDPEKPAIGDLRVAFRRMDLDNASVIGGQSGDRLTRYATSNGRELFFIQKGKATAAEMFKDAMANNTALTWVIRAGGLLAMFIGFNLTFKLITGIADMIPVIGGLIRAGTSLISVVMTLALGSIIIAAGWVFYRPLLALVIVAVGVGLAVVLGVVGKKKAAPAAVA